MSKIKPTTALFNCMVGDCFKKDDPKPDPEPEPEPVDYDVNLHIVPHSHTDAGWIETIDWYYDNKIRNIFKNVIKQLEDDHSLTFVWADTNFLHQWYESQNSKTQKKFRKIVERGQIEFTGGGWVQNDESLSDIKSIINQMNLGLQYLNERFNATPTVGWQIDPFGYNHFMPSVFKELGFKYLVLNRIGDSRKEDFKETQSMDFWLESADIGNKDSSILTHVLPRHYEPYDFQGLLVRIPKSSSTDKYKKEFVQYFYETYLEEQLKGYSSKQYMLLMGQDFGYSSSDEELKKIKDMNEIITEYSKEAVGIQINAKFSLPTKYFEALEKEKNLTTKNMDFINYDERLIYLHEDEDFEKIDYWVGYYSTRPHLKKIINEAFNNFRTLETLATYVEHKGKFDEKFKETYNEIEIQLSYLLHHDSITGTSRKATIDDYYKRVGEAQEKINTLMNEMNNILLGEKTEVVLSSLPGASGNQSLYYFNQAAYKRKMVIKIPDSYEHVRLFDQENKKFCECELLKSKSNTLYCLIEIDGLSLKTFNLEFSSKEELSHEAKIITPEKLEDSPKEYENDHYKIHLDKDGLVKSYKSKKVKKELDLEQQFNYYRGSRSGLYVFKPTKDKTSFQYLLKKAEVFKGDLVTVITTSSEQYISQKITIFNKGDTQIAPLVETTAQSWEYVELGFAMNVKQMSKKKMLYNHDSNEFVKREFKEIEKFEESGKNIYPAVHGYAINDGDMVFGIANNYPTG